MSGGNDLFDRISASVERALQPVLDAMAQQVRQRIGVPVDKSKRPWVRSKPGEPPRKDTGQLQASTNIQTIDANSEIRGSVSVERPYARRLNNEMDRPIFGDILQQNRDTILNAMRRGVTNPNNNGE